MFAGGLAIAGKRPLAGIRISVHVVGAVERRRRARPTGAPPWTPCSPRGSAIGRSPGREDGRRSRALRRRVTL